MTRSHYSFMSLLRHGLGGHRGWAPVWRFPEPKASYDVVVIGAGLAIYVNRDITARESAPTANHERLADEAAEELIASWADFHDLPDAGIEDGLGAGRSLAVARAGLERDHHRVPAIDRDAARGR